MPGEASRWKLGVYCDCFHWVNKTFTSARRAQHPFVGILVSLSSVRRSELGSGGEAKEGSCCVIRSSLRDYLIYRYSPVLSAHVFSCPSLSSRVFRRDSIDNDLTVLFQIIGVGGVRHHLKASGMTQTHYLLLKHYYYRDFILKLVSYSIGPFWFIFYLISSTCHQNRSWRLPWPQDEEPWWEHVRNARKISYHFSAVLTVEAPCVPSWTHMGCGENTRQACKSRTVNSASSRNSLILSSCCHIRNRVLRYIKKCFWPIRARVVSQLFYKR